MIKTVADLIENLKQHEMALLEKYDNIGHNPTIGSMYEGLTSEMLKQSIFDGLNLNVVSGKIKNSNNDFSDQIDCMIVVGEGE